MFRKKIFLLLGFLLIFIPRHSFAIGTGSSVCNGLEFEQIANARAAAMAGSVSAMSGDINFMHFNPAGIASLKKPEVGFNYMISPISLVGSENMYFANIAVAQPFIGGNLGISFSYFNAGTMDLSGTAISSQNISALTDLVFALSYAFRTGQHIYLGISYKMILSIFAEQYSANAQGVDCGIIYKTPIKGFDVGLAATNFGTPLVYNTVEENLPTKIKTGCSYNYVFTKELNASFNVELNYLVAETDYTTSFGTEFSYMDFIFIRMGYMIATQDTGLYFGGGVNLNNYYIDYAYEPPQVFSSFANQRIGLKIRF